MLKMIEPKMIASLTIGRLARASGVGVETVRFYERVGLVSRPRRPQQGFRAYPADTVARIRFIRHAQGLGFTLREVKDLLSLRTDPNADCAVVRQRAEAKRNDVTARIERLDEIRRALDTLIAACPGKGQITACTILDAFNERPHDSADTRQEKSLR